MEQQLINFFYNTTPSKINNYQQSLNKVEFEVIEKVIKTFNPSEHTAAFVALLFVNSSEI